MLSRLLSIAALVLLGCSEADPPGASASATSSGQGGGGTGAGAHGGGGGGAPIDRCPDGPYGVEQLYFGAPEPEPLLDYGVLISETPLHDQGGVQVGENAYLGTAHMSPDGLELLFPHSLVDNTQGCGDGGCYETVQLTRASLADPWSAPSSYIQSFWADVPRIFLDRHGLFACHGGARKCAFYARAGQTGPWPFGYGPDPDHFVFGPPLPQWNGAAFDYWFTPTPDGERLAFGSNRTSDVDDEPVVAFDSGVIDLWTAVATDPSDPTAGYADLRRWDGPSSPVSEDAPEWFSEGGTTLFFHSRMPGDATLDVYVTTRGSAADPFVTATKVEIVSSPSANDDVFTLPAVSAMKADGNRGVGYVRRVVGGVPIGYERFAVCVGSKNP